MFPYFGDFRISFGEGPYALHPDRTNYLTIWFDKLNLGYPFSSQTLIFLFTFIYKILGLFSFIAHPSIIYVFFGGYFLAGLFFYLTLKSLVKLSNNLLYLPPVLLYVFNIYRVQAGNSDENMLLFISLPLFFLFYHKLLHELRWRYVFVLATVSILTSTLGKNLAMFSIPYILMMIYHIYFFFIGGYKKNPFRVVLLNSVLVVLVLGSNLFWLLPQSELLTSYYILSDKGKNLWNVLDSGTFFDHFRFMGFWAFRDAGYFPYTNLYYQPIFLITTFTVSIFSFFYFFFLKDKTHRNLIVFFAIFTVLSYLLVSGTKGAAGFFYQMLYNSIGIFAMYREPYAKFTPFYIFASSFGLLFSLYYLCSFVRNKLVQFGIIAVLSVIILMNAFPLFTVTYVAKPTLPRTRSAIVKVPDYWLEFNEYFKRLKTNQWLFIFQNNGYGTNSNWEYGVNVVGNIADYITDKSIHTIRNINIDISETGVVINNIFRNSYEISDLKVYLGLLNSRYILQENDTEWRYGSIVLPPSQSNKLLKDKGFAKVAEFGRFTSDYLKRIPNIDPDPKTQKQLYRELLNQPGLVLYKMEDAYFVPAIYTPKKIVVSPRSLKDLASVVKENNSVLPLLIFLNRQNATSYADTYFKEIQKNNLVADRPLVEYKKINSTKYRVRIHQAKTNFPLVFSNNFNVNWKVYLSQYNDSEIDNRYLENYRIFEGNEGDQATKNEVLTLIKRGWVSDLDKKSAFISKVFQKTVQNDNLADGRFYETWTKTPYDEKYHLTGNGYANSWIIDISSTCALDKVCRKNADGSYDFELVIDNLSQRYFLVELFFAVFILVFSILFIVGEFIYNKFIKRQLSK